jgi:hypothetical protein
VSEREKPFIVKSEKAFGALKHWLKERGCNTYSFSDSRKINVGYDTKPDSDWGKYTWKGSIIICDPGLFPATEAAIQKAYGWEPTHDR